ncbi:hypothetical protein PSHT_05478 [Puccinia striiformis]|uniref:BD-FAE-like domain-containing protein n=1 Tax=Puccinia striiformis TaxID=27350 RepID=A0A2S4WA69_9BASI|nr:hypothetical protein PSHT_05478 [Puccinia striiformis]
MSKNTALDEQPSQTLIIDDEQLNLLDPDHPDQRSSQAHSPDGTTAYSAYSSQPPLLPVTIVVGLPIWISSTIILVYSLAWIPYLLFAQDDLSSHQSILLPFSPIKVLRIVTTLVKHLIILLRSNWIELVLDYSYRKIIVMGRDRKTNKNTPSIVTRNIIYGYTDEIRKRNKRLDVYLPPSFNNSSTPVTTDSHNLAPVFVLRRLGFCVVIPDFVSPYSNHRLFSLIINGLGKNYQTQFPEGRCDHSVRDIRCALKWVSRSISQYGGNPDRIFLAGHGSGAHLSLLTVLESSITRCLEEQGYPIVNRGPEELDIPAIEGMILISGIYDPINQIRDEVRVGWHHILATRRALGPSHSATLSNSPARLLHWAQNFLAPKFLPNKFLIIHGGQDKNVPILQSHFLYTLLENINRQQQLNTTTDDQSSCYSRSAAGGGEGEGSANNNHKSVDEVKVTFKALKNLDHLAGLVALMIPDSTHHSNHDGYSKIIIDEILALVG